jgi:hypothetical protein
VFPPLKCLGPSDHVPVSPNIWRPLFVLRQNKPMMALKKATSKATIPLDAMRRRPSLRQKGKTTLVGDAPQDAPENDRAINSKRPRTENPPTLEGTFHTCCYKGLPQNPPPPPGFTPPEADGIIENDEVLGILAEDQLQLREIRIKNNHMQKQKEILAAKRQCTNMQAKVRQMIL